MLHIVKAAAQSFTTHSYPSLRADVSYFLEGEEGNRGSARRLTAIPDKGNKNHENYSKKSHYDALAFIFPSAIA